MQTEKKLTFAEFGERFHYVPPYERQMLYQAYRKMKATGSMKRIQRLIRKESDKVTIHLTQDAL